MIGDILHAVIPGPPASWQRATVHGGRTLTPKGMRQAKAHARAALSAAALAGRWEPATGPVRLTLVFVRNRKPDAVPDGDNLAKMVMDSGNGILWDDDARVVELHAVKRRPGEGEAECTIVTIERLEGER
jgi:Holliday junction resolvase RusA-like endonuclease